MFKHKSRGLLLLSLLLAALLLIGCGSDAVEFDAGEEQQEEVTEPATEEEPADEPTEEEPAAEEPTEEPEAEPAEEEASEDEAAEDEASDEEAAEDEEIRIALFHPVLGNTYTAAVSDGATEVAEQMGASVSVFGADPAYDPVAQSNQIQDAITSGEYDAFIIYAVDGNAVVPDVEDAVEAGITVVAADVVIGPDSRSTEPCCGIVSYVGRTGYDHGMMLGEMIVQACEGIDPCEVGYLNGAQSLTIDQDRVAAIEEVLSEHDHIEIVANQEAFYLEDEGLEVAQNILLANPDIDVLATSGDQMMLGAEQAVIDAGLEGEVRLLGNGTSERGYEAVQEGRFWANYADIPYTMGQIAAGIAVDALRGEDVPSFVNNDEQIPPLPEGGPIITQENVDQFESQW